MLCPKCGAQIRRGLTFCPKCGAEFGAPLLGPNDRIIEVNKDMTEEELSGGFGGTRGFDGAGSTGPGTFGGPGGAGSFGGADPFAGAQGFGAEKRFYEKTWFAILALIFCWPVGIFLMWRYMEWPKPAKVVLSIVYGLLLLGGVAGNGGSEDRSVGEAPTVQTTEATTTAPTTEDLSARVGRDAEQLIASRQAYFDDLKFEELTKEADAILEEGDTVLSAEDREDLQDLSACSAALGKIHNANYTFSEVSDPSESDYETLKNSQYCPDEVYGALTAYEEYNNQCWKREDIEEHDDGEETTTYRVTAFTSFELKDEAEGFEADNIKPVLKLDVEYDGEDESLNGTDTVSAEEAVGDSAEVSLDDGSDCAVDIDEQKEISLSINGQEHTLSNIVTAASEVEHRTDLRTRAAGANDSVDSDSGSYTVYITRTGSKYHSSGCSYLKDSKIPIDKDDAEAQGFDPCSRCNP